MIRARLENITPFSHPAMHFVANEMRLRGRLTSKRIQRRLQAWTIDEQEARRQTMILDLLRWHGQQSAIRETS